MFVNRFSFAKFPPYELQTLGLRHTVPYFQFHLRSGSYDYCYRSSANYKIHRGNEKLVVFLIGGLVKEKLPYQFPHHLRGQWNGSCIQWEAHSTELPERLVSGGSNLVSTFRTGRDCLRPDQLRGKQNYQEPQNPQTNQTA